MAAAIRNSGAEIFHSAEPLLTGQGQRRKYSVEVEMRSEELDDSKSRPRLYRDEVPLQDRVKRQLRVRL